MATNNSTKKISNTNEKYCAPKPIVRYAIDDFFDEIVQVDYDNLMEKVDLDTTNRVKELHLMHSVYGHASNGHGEFYEMVDDKKVPVKYKNITMDDIISRIPGEKIENVKQDRQDVIDMIKEYVYDSIDALANPNKISLQKDTRLVKIANNKHVKNIIIPLAGASMFKNTLISDSESLIMACYLGCCMDSNEYREKTDERFGTSMHKGMTVPVNILALKRYDVTLDDLQDGRYLNKMPELLNLDSKKRVEVLINKGIIPKQNVVPNDKIHTSAFIELSKGYGISDDAAYITASLMFGVDSGLGLLLADAIDTFDKYTTKIVFGGQDESFGQALKERYESRLNKSFPISEDQITTLIYMGSMNKENYDSFPSCSQRRFWQKDEYGMTAVQSHISFMNFLKGNPNYPPPSKIGFSAVLNNQFYGAYIAKLEDAFAKGIMSDNYSLSEKKKAMGIDSDSMFNTN